MTTKPTPFKDIIGQTAAKKQLNFYLRGFDATGIVPHIMLVAPKGAGKTMIGKQFGREMKALAQKHGITKKIVTINCAGIRSLDSFLNDYIIPYCIDDDCTLFLDECSELPKQVAMALLTILNPNKDNRNLFTYKDFEWDVDFKRISFVFATTEAQDVFHALMDRCERIDLQEYSTEEISEIITTSVPDIKFKNNILKLVAPTCKGTGRKAYQIAQKMQQYCAAKKSKVFDKKDWDKLSDELDILPLGINHTELKLLRILFRYNNCRLTNLAAKMNMTKASVQRDAETYLQQKNLIGIDTQGRFLTKEGRELVLNINESRTV
jgi:Holliday junction resolvasome RuvABC ATP-dependent DNA helicase subunit|tara:strand:- start:241 stop:1206 length:966 start_codon:yes stop_codon:yes gene_type:complete